MSLTKLFIVNDGDPFADSHANFAFYVKEGANTVQTFRDDWDIADGQTIPLAFPPVVIGPKKIDRQNHDITLFIAGTDEDGPTETDEVAANFLGNAPLGPRSIEFPTGTNEQVQNKPHEFKAKPRSGDDDFEFTVTANFSIEYS